MCLYGHCLFLSVHCDILTKQTEGDILSKSTTTTTTLPKWSEEEIQKVNKVLSDAGKIVPDPPKDVVTTSTTIAEDNFKYAYEKHDVSANIDSITYLGLNDDVIWPGAIVKGDKVRDFVYDPITLKRAPITVSISVPGEYNKETVNEPKLSNIRDTIANILKKNMSEGTKLAANAEFKFHDVYSESDMGIKIGASVTYKIAKFSGSFDWQKSEKKNKILASYKQVYYTLDVDTPKTPADFFSGDNSVDEIKRQLPPGSNPVYVSSVSYGFMAFLCIESNYSKEQIESAFSASLSTKNIDVTIDGQFTSGQILRESKYSIIVYGGSTQGLDNLDNSIESFKKLISCSTNYSPDTQALPLIYRFRHVSDNTLAAVTLTSQYTLVSKLNKARQKVKVTCTSFVCTKADDEGTDNRVDLSELFAGLHAYHSDGTRFYADWFYRHGSTWETNEGALQINSEKIIEFNLDFPNKSFEDCRLDLFTHVKDYDSTSEDEVAEGSIVKTGSGMLGSHDVSVSSSDFDVTCKFTVSLTQ